MNHEELQQQYALDALLSDTPWKWWECSHMATRYWEPMPKSPVWSLQYDYRRKSTAPDWSKELSPKEVAECDDWPDFTIKTNEQGVICIRDVDDKVWTERVGWTHKPRISLLRHFKKRREAALATYGNAEESQEVTKRDHKPSKDEILRDEAIARFTEKATSKFNAGIQEHNPNGGNDLEDRATFADLEDEIIDLWYYVQGLKRRIHRT